MGRRELCSSTFSTTAFVGAMVGSTSHMDCTCFKYASSGIICSTYYATTCAHGRLYLADIRKATDMESQMDPLVTAAVRLFQVDIASGSAQLRTEFLLKKSYKTDVHMQEINPGNVEEFHTGRVLTNLELVECMGHLYAVIPARLDEFLYQPNGHWRKNIWSENLDTIGSEYMPLQFYVFQLEGPDHVGVVRIQAPSGRKHIARRQSLVKYTSISQQDNRDPRLRNWFSCSAKGSVIWVSVEDYLVQYDVFSGECTTEIVPRLARKNEETAGVPFRASFDMKP